MSTTPKAQGLSQSQTDEDYFSRLVAAATVLLVLTSLLLALRLYARTLTAFERGWDEFLLPVAWILVVGACIASYLLVTIGGAGHLSQKGAMTDSNTLVIQNKLVYAIGWCAFVSNGLSRVSIVALYFRIFLKGMTRFFSSAVLFYLIGLLMAQIITGITICRPIQYYWDQSIPGGRCINLILFWRLTAALNVIGDVVIMVIPIYKIWKLHASTTRRAGIALVFLSGSVGLVASCIRTYIFFHDKQFSDPTWNVIWTLIESSMYLSAACLIGLRPILSVTSQWLKKRVATWQQRIARTKCQKEQDDMSGSFEENVGSGMRLGSFTQDMELGRDVSTRGSVTLVRSESQVVVTDQRPKNNRPKASIF